MKRLNLALALSLAGVVSLWLARFQGSVTVLAGFVVLFLILRGISTREVLATAAGAAAAAFLLPVNLWGAMAAFALVQILAESLLGTKAARDRFRESRKTAERVLDGLGDGLG